MGTRKSRFETAFGAALSVQLAQNGMNASGLARSLGCSPSYTSGLMTGRNRASPEWVELVANALALPANERVKLHHAAASDYGYKLDLTK